MKLRSIVAIRPGGENLGEALAGAADAILLSLANDTRPVGALRNTAIEALHAINEASKRGIVLVNHPRTQLLREDLDAVLSHNLSAVFLAHAHEPQDVRDTAVLLREFELARDVEPGTVAIFPVIDSARGLLRAPEIAQAAPRVGGLVFDSDAYARDTMARIEAKGPRLAYARGAVVAAARAFDTLPIIEAEPVDLLDLAHYGFAGAVLPDDRPVATANAAFAPTDAELERARALASAYDAARGEGGWVARTGTELADAHAARKARQLLE